MSRRWCAGTRPDGAPCRSRPLRDGDRCMFHDPAHATEAAEARRLGGLRRRREGTIWAAFETEDLRTVDGLWRMLEIVFVDTLHLDNGLGRNRTLLAGISSATRLMTAEDVERRLAAIERALRPAGDVPTGGTPSLLDEDPDADR
jgi:hypothetical protein